MYFLQALLFMLISFSLETREIIVLKLYERQDAVVRQLFLTPYQE